jgi:hypothetical protein
MTKLYEFIKKDIHQAIGLIKKQSHSILAASGVEILTNSSARSSGLIFSGTHWERHIEPWSLD